MQSVIISDLERFDNEHSDQLASMQDSIAKLSAMLESLNKKSDELEACSRWNNIRRVGLPEGSAGPHPMEFTAVLLRDLLGLNEMPGLDRAHRTLRAKPRETKPLCLMVIRVTQFQVRNAILRRAGQRSPLLHNGKKVFIFSDFTLTVTKRRAALIKVKRELCACANVKFCPPLPSYSTHYYTQRPDPQDPEQALEFVKRLMKNPVSENG